MIVSNTGVPHVLSEDSEQVAQLGRVTDWFLRPSCKGVAARRSVPAWMCVAPFAVAALDAIGCAPSHLACPAHPTRPLVYVDTRRHEAALCGLFMLIGDAELALSRPKARRQRKGESAAKTGRELTEQGISA